MEKQEGGSETVFGYVGAPRYILFMPQDSTVVTIRGRCSKCVGVVVDGSSAIDRSINIRPVGVHGASRTVELRLPVNRVVIGQLVNALNKVLEELETWEEQQDG